MIQLSDLRALRLKVPEGHTAESWLSTIDSQPRLIPRWPESKRMTLVAVACRQFHTDKESAAEAYVITKRSQADALVDFEASLDSTGVLFFRVPKHTVLDPQVTPEGLTESDWETPFVSLED